MHAAASLRERLVARLLEASDRDLAPSDITDATTLRDDLELSSLQSITLAMELEDEFGITVDDEELEAFGTVGDVLKLVTAKAPADPQSDQPGTAESESAER